MDGNKLDQLRRYAYSGIRPDGSQRDLAEWALDQIDELIREKTELQIDLHDCAAVMSGTPYIDTVIKGGVPLPTALRKMVTDLRVHILNMGEAVDDAAEEWSRYVKEDTAPCNLQTYMADALAKLLPKQ